MPIPDCKICEDVDANLELVVRIRGAPAVSTYLPSNSATEHVAGSPGGLDHLRLDGVARPSAPGIQGRPGEESS